MEREVVFAPFDAEIDIGAHPLQMLARDERAHLGFGIGAWGPL